MMSEKPQRQRETHTMRGSRPWAATSPRGGWLAVSAAIIFGVSVASSASAQTTASAIAWKDCLDQPAGWYGSAEATRIADNLIVYQRRSGGWPKNIEMARAMTPTDRATVTDEKDLNDSTIDNNSTYTQLRYLARVFEVTRIERCKTAFLAGLDYLFKAQYPNGGWPQYYPLRENYSRYITFNDTAMIGVMNLLKETAEAAAPFGFVDQTRRAKAVASIDRGLRVILRSQIRVGGRLTAWCAQVDPVTLEPRGARSYEHPSISGKESVDIVRYLMGIGRPGPEVVTAIESAVAFYRDNQVKGLRLVSKLDPALPHGRDVVAEDDPNAPPLWARFYEVGTNRPIYSGRDGIVKYKLAEIEVERRAGYSWLGPYAVDLLQKDHPAWRQRLN
jgi:PelA/Pel-15E family pectate lyase